LRTRLWVDFRLHRFEVVAVWLGGLALTVAALLISQHFSTVNAPAGCFASVDVHGAVSIGRPECVAAVNAYARIDTNEAGPYFAFPLIFAAAAGLLLGVAAMSRELERGTAPLPWTLTGSRWRWLGARATVLLLLVLAAVLPVALAGDYLEGVRAPGVEAAKSFADEAARGWPLLAVSAASFCVGLAIGTLMGRQLPALIVAAVVMGMILTGVAVAMDHWSAAVAETRPVDAGRLGDRSIDARFQSHADGRLLSMTEATALQPLRPDLPEGTVDDRWLQENFTEVLLLVPGNRYPEAVALRSAVLILVAAASAGLSLLLVERRRLG
jgi:hypothetical protein